MNGIGKKLDLVRRAVDSIRASIPSDQFAGQPPQVRDAVRAYRAIASQMDRYLATTDGEGLLQDVGFSEDATLDELQESYSRELELLSRSIVKCDRFKGLRK